MGRWRCRSPQTELYLSESLVDRLGRCLMAVSHLLRQRCRSPVRQPGGHCPTLWRPSWFSAGWGRFGSGLQWWSSLYQGSRRWRHSTASWEGCSRPGAWMPRWPAQTRRCSLSTCSWACLWKTFRWRPGLLLGSPHSMRSGGGCTGGSAGCPQTYWYTWVPMKTSGIIESITIWKSNYTLKHYSGILQGWNYLIPLADTHSGICFFLGRTEGLNSVSSVKRKLVVLSCVARRQPMDSDPFITSMEGEMKDERKLEDLDYYLVKKDLADVTQYVTINMLMSW